MEATMRMWLFSGVHLLVSVLTDKSGAVVCSSTKDRFRTDANV